MRVISAKMKVGTDHRGTVELPPDVAPGSHEAVIVISEPAEYSASGLSFAEWPAHQVGLADPGQTFRREDLYGDGGR